MNDGSNRRRGFTLIELLIVLAVIGLIVAIFLPATRRVRPAARMTQCKNNLKQIGLALHNYHDRYEAFPPAYTVDADGKPLHSWRTLLLPYLDQAPLYNLIDLSRPWNDPANAGAFESVVHAYCCPSHGGPNDRTTYLAVVTEHSCLRPGASVALKDILDRPSNTMIVIEVNAADAVRWMEPRDANLETAGRFLERGKDAHPTGVHVLVADGSVHTLNPGTVEPKLLYGLSTVNGHESICDEF
ncbi:MAG TPA: DUF1559 domain-containing protein [Planctomycetaceae bacterium]|nr:DUF1559 domain-containing protein [Planctomycetaceae bacterium]